MKEDNDIDKLFIGANERGRLPDMPEERLASMSARLTDLNKKRKKRSPLFWVLPIAMLLAVLAYFIISGTSGLNRNSDVSKPADTSPSNESYISEGTGDPSSVEPNKQQKVSSITNADTTSINSKDDGVDVTSTIKQDVREDDHENTTTTTQTTIVAPKDTLEAIIDSSNWEEPVEDMVPEIEPVEDMVPEM